MNAVDAAAVGRDATVALLVLAGAAFALLGSFGLLRLPTFSSACTRPALVATLGCWCVTMAPRCTFRCREAAWPCMLLLIALFIAVTVPITTIFLMRAALFRARQMGQNVPPNVSATATGPGHTRL